MLLHEHLLDRAASDGSTPFLTHYRADDRTELSARSFANWVAKTANLLTDELGLDPGDRVELRVAANHPGHWMTLVWVMATWQAGLTVTDADGDVIVTGPEPAGTPNGPALACSLHPLGLGLRDLPEGWSDFSALALAQPDAWFGSGPDSPDDPAWEVAGRALSFAQLTTGEPESRRLLVRDPEDAWAAAHACLIGPLLGGGSSVIACDVSDAALARIAESERVDA